MTRCNDEWDESVGPPGFNADGTEEGADNRRGSGGSGTTTTTGNRSNQNQQQQRNAQQGEEGEGECDEEKVKEEVDLLKGMVL